MATMAELLPVLRRALPASKVLPMICAGVSDAGGRLRTDCPHCHNPAIILEHEVVCLAAHCEFRTGSVFDVAAFRQGGDFQKGIETIRKRFPEVEKLKAEEWDVLAPKIASETTTARALLHFFIRRVGAINRMDPLLIGAADLMKRLGIAPSLLGDTTFLLVHPVVTELLELVRSYTGSKLKVKIPEAAIYTVTPFFSSPSRIGWIAIGIPESPSLVYVRVDPCRFSYAGLWALTGSCDRAIFSGDLVNGLRLMTHARAAGLHEPHLVVRYDPESEEQGFKFNTALFLLPAGESMFLAGVSAAAAEKYLVGEHVIGHGAKAGEPLVDYITRRLIQLYDAHQGLNGDVKRFLSQVSLTREIRQQLFDRLVQHGYGKLAAALRNEDVTGGVYEVRNSRVIERSNGYFVRRRGDTVDTRVTNFTLQLGSNVRFPGSDEMAVVGEGVYFEHHFPVHLSSEQLYNPMALDTAVKSAWFKSGIRLLDEHGAMRSPPSVIDRRNATMLGIVFNQIRDTLPLSEGVSSMGWSPDQDAFNGAGWRVTRSGKLESVAYYAPPDCPPMQMFVKVTPRRAAGVDPRLADLYALGASMVARRFIDRPIKTVFFANTADVRATLQRFFQGTGQRMSWRINSNVRGFNNDSWMSGMPVLLSGYERPDSRANYPAFAIADSGISLPDLTSQMTLDAGADFAFTMAEVAAWVLRTEGREIPEPHQTDDNVADAHAEGVSILKKACPSRTWTFAMEGYLGIRAWLRSITIGEARASIRFDASSSTCIIQSDLPKSALLDFADLGGTTVGREMRVPAERFLPVWARVQCAEPGFELASA